MSLSIVDYAKKLADWVIGVVEDDPIPIEVKYLYFLIVHDLKGFHLEFGGRELKTPIVDFLDYHPLDAKFFDRQYFEDETEFILFLEEVIDEAFLNLEFKQIFEGKKLFVTVFGKKFMKKIL